MVVAFSLNVIILIVLMKKKKYITLPFRLLLVSTVIWIAMYCVVLINFLTMYIIQAPNGVRMYCSSAKS